MPNQPIKFWSHYFEYSRLPHIHCNNGCLCAVLVSSLEITHLPIKNWIVILNPSVPQCLKYCYHFWLLGCSAPGAMTLCGSKLWMSSSSISFHFLKPSFWKKLGTKRIFWGMLSSSVPLVPNCLKSNDLLTITSRRDLPSSENNTSHSLSSGIRKTLLLRSPPYLK